MGTEVFRLPDLGEGLPEAELVQWLVAEGDPVTLNQTIAEVETAKAVVEIPSPHAGVVRTLHAAAGETVSVGEPLISFDLDTDTAAGADGETPAVRAASSPQPEPEPEAEETAQSAQPNLVGYGAAPLSSARPRRRPRIEIADATAEPFASTGPDAADAEPLGGRPRSTPPVRALAKSLGLDLSRITGTGPDGSITRADVETAAAGERGSAVAHPTDARTTRIPIRGVRKHTAEAMVRSAFTAPHATTFLTVDVTRTTALIRRLRADPDLAEHRIGILALAARAVCMALPRHPALNSAWDEQAGEIVEHHYVNLGIAAATERGLVVPHIPDAQALGLAPLADAIRELAATARAGRTPPAAMRGGTFSITNVGVFGIDAGTPILNPGEAGILALGAVNRRPWEHRGGVALREVTTLALSFDHRLVDGEQGARFLAEVAGILRDPGRAVLYA